jgi:pyrroloquinoline quinone biosynthesis protein D
VTAGAEALPDAARPFLPRGVRLRWCGVRQAWFLLAPERAVKLDAVGSAILTAVDGKRDFSDLVAKLAADFGAPAERVAADARRFLADLMARRMVEVA